MTPRDYEIAMFARSVWQLAYSSDQMELLAVACAIRNQVIPRLGQVPAYVGFPEACEDYMSNFLRRDPPRMSDDAFILPPDGLLCHISAIYDGVMQDVTATQDHPNGAKYFARVTAVQESWIRQTILSRPLIGTFGSMQFFE